MDWSCQAGSCGPSRSLLVGRNDDFDATVVGATVRRAVVGDGARRTEALRGDLVARNAARYQVGTDGIGALERQRVVVAGLAPRVGVTFDDDRLEALIGE